jgi:Ca-activated chloride channel family protein
MKKLILLGSVPLGAILLTVPSFSQNGAGKDNSQSNLPGAQMVALDSAKTKIGLCPLERTEVHAKLAGVLGRTKVKQIFGNPFSRKIEALYTFPLPPGAAIDAFTMTVGKRKIVGEVQTKDKAKATYEAAKRKGHVAALLDQQRPNLFSQNVANILPGQKVEIEISYSENVKWADGAYEWAFPLTVGPRFTPPVPGDDAIDRRKARPAPSKADLPSEITAGSASIDVEIAAGQTIRTIESSTHEITVKKDSAGEAEVVLKNGETVPNRDFVLHYSTATDSISDSFLTSTDGRGTYFSLTLQPPQRVDPKVARSKELIFVADRSGSMDGFALEATKKAMTTCMESLHAGDTFNVMSFSFGPEACFRTSVTATKANRKIAARYLDSLEARGGTNMLPAIRAALQKPTDPKRLRIVVFATDGFVENDFEIVAAVKKYAGQAHVFAFGAGSTVNRYLLDGIALAGRGEAEYLTSEKESEDAAKRFQGRIDSPVLTDLSLDWGTLPVTEVYPKALPDLFASKPLVVTGRLGAGAHGFLTLHGRTAAGPFVRKIAINAPKPIDNEAIASLWARSKVADVMSQDLTGLQFDRFQPTLKKQIEDLGVEYHLLTQFTSFVAVDKESDTGPDEPDAMKIDPAATDEEKAETPTRYGANSGGSFSGRAGDPLLRVSAPANAAQVVAVMPSGEVKALVFNAATKSWEARFDIPTWVPDGNYAVAVMIVDGSGLRNRVQLHFRVDNKPVQGMGQLKVRGDNWRLEVSVGEEVNRVSALLPWGQKLDLSQQNGRFAAEVAIPESFRDQKKTVTFLLTDTAHNRTTISVDENN